MIDKAISATYLAKTISGEENVKIAGSVPPLFGSYTTNIDVSSALKFYPIIFDTLDNDERVDILLIETVSSFEEADLAMSFAIASHKPYCISFTLVEDELGVLRSGENITEIIPLLEKYASNLPEAILFNCSPPEVMLHSIEKMYDIKNLITMILL